MDKKFFLKISMWNGDDDFIVSSTIIDEQLAINIQEKYNNIDTDFYCESLNSNLEFFVDGISNIEITEIDELELYVLNKFGYIKFDDDKEIDTNNTEFAINFINELLNYDNDLYDNTNEGV